MKRDMNLVRALLLHLESRLPGDENSAILITKHMPDFDDADAPEYADRVIYHAVLLLEAGLIVGTARETEQLPCAYDVEIERMTWEGHDFLDSIRSDKVWRRVRERLATVGGEASLDVVKQLAVQIARDLLFGP